MVEPRILFIKMKFPDWIIPLQVIEFCQ